MSGRPAEVHVLPMNRARARQMTDEAKTMLAGAGRLLLRVQRERGWEALGYPSWVAYLDGEFADSRTHLFRLLAAERTRETLADRSPIGDTRHEQTSINLDAVPESILRPLNQLREIPREQREAWEHAVEAAGGEVPTAAQVAEAVDEVLCRVNGEPAEDPPDVAGRRAAGRIGPGVRVEVTEPEVEPVPDPTAADAGPAEPAGPSEDDLDDAAWLETLPARARLGGASRRWFDADALLYREVEEDRRSFANRARRALAAARRRGGSGAYAFLLSRFVRIDHPKHWLVCPSPADGGCGGSGTLGVIGQCPKCHGRGYWIK